MKKLLFLSVLSVLSVAFLCGCMTNHKETTNKFDPTGKVRLEENIKEDYLATTYKNIILEFNVYAVAAAFFDPTTGNMSPYIKLGIFREKYYSYPVIPGQGITIVDEEYSSSWWNWTTFFNGTPDTKTNLVRRTIIVISPVPDGKQELNMSAGQGVGCTIDANGLTIPQALKIDLK